MKKRWASKAWITCACDFRGIRRAVMGGRSWTELFFLDEAVALAAGHRPCFFCRREAAERFRACWAQKPGHQVSAVEMDGVLHAERLDGRTKRLHPIDGPPATLPDGAVVAVGAAAFTVRGGLAYRWTEAGYAVPQRIDRADWLLTPPAILRALRAGYAPVFHPSTESQDGG